VRVTSAARIAAGAVFALFILGCALPEDGSDQSAPGSTVASGTAADPSATESLEGLFDYTQMDDYLDVIVPWISDWSRLTWPDMSEPEVFYVKHGAGGNEGCAESSGAQGRYSSASFEYCGADQVIYVGQDTLWAFYSEAGDAAPAAGLAHEWGHHVQESLGVPDPRSAEESVNHENQADCLSGAWIRYTDQQGHLEPEDDLKDLGTLFPMIGSAEDPDRDHGTTSERIRSFNVGLKGGAAACDAFYPRNPVA
jgi:hypothetical protein